MESEIEKIEQFFKERIDNVVGALFNELKNKSIDVNKERKELSLKDLEEYNKIYYNYEKELINIKNESEKNFGRNLYIDLIFAITIQKTVSEKQEL